MSTPEFVLELRKKIGHDLLWLNGVTGCVLNEHGQLLLGRRSDTGEWAMVYGDNTMYMDHSFLCALKPGGNAEPFVGDEESLSVGWFDLDDLPTPLAASTSERLELFHTYIENKKHGDAHALFQFDGQQY